MVMAAVAGAALVGGAVGMATSGSPDIPGPDPSIGIAQQQMADLAERQQDYYEKTVSPIMLAAVQQQTDVAKATSTAQINQMNEQTRQSSMLNDRYWGTQVPLEDSLISKALKFNTKAEQEQMAGEAGADVTQALQVGQTSLAQQLRARGVNLGSGAAVSAMTEMNTQAMLAKTTAINKTRETARQMGWQRLGEATALGKGLTSFGQGSAALAINAGTAANNSAASATGAATALGNSSAQNTAALGTLYGGMGQLGVSSTGLAQNAAEYNYSNDPMRQVYGAMMGYGSSYLTGAAGRSAGAASSDIRLKKNIQRIGTSSKGHNLYSWDWKDGSGSAAGVLAQEVWHVPGAVVEGDDGYLRVFYDKVL